MGISNIYTASNKWLEDSSLGGVSEYTQTALKQ